MQSESRDKNKLNVLQNIHNTTDLTGQLNTRQKTTNVTKL